MDWSADATGNQDWSAEAAAPAEPAAATTADGGW